MSSLLRPNQVTELKDEQKRIQDQMKNHPEMIQDPQGAKRQLNNIHKMLETQAPKEFKGAAVDAAVKENEALKEKSYEVCLQVKKCENAQQVQSQSIRTGKSVIKAT